MDQFHPENGITEIKRMVAELSCEARVRLRQWLCASYDGNGRQKTVTSDVESPLYRPSDFERMNVREFLRLGRLKDRGLPPDSGGVYALASERDWLYVGKAKSLANRRTHHVSALRHGHHPNILLQRHWDSSVEPIWYIVLQRWPPDVRLRRGIEHPDELRWKRLLRPLYDREARSADISFFIDPGSPDHCRPTVVKLVDRRTLSDLDAYPMARATCQPVKASPSWTWAGGPPTLPRWTSKSCGLPS
jgi:hypothetical protein